MSAKVIGTSPGWSGNRSTMASFPTTSSIVATRSASDVVRVPPRL
jgi:hypothetical protein